MRAERQHAQRTTLEGDCGRGGVWDRGGNRGAPCEGKRGKLREEEQNAGTLHGWLDGVDASRANAPGA